jgi:hypothetical protein
MANLLNRAPKNALGSLSRSLLSIGEQLSFQVSWVGKRRQKNAKSGIDVITQMVEPSQVQAVDLHRRSSWRPKPGPYRVKQKRMMHDRDIVR